SSSAGADALRERSLGNQFQFRSPASVELGEDGRVGGARKRTNDLGNAARFEQRREADLAAAGVVADRRQIRGALVDQRVDELDWTARFAETAEHDGGAVENVRDSLGRARHPLVDHRLGDLKSSGAIRRSGATRRLSGSRHPRVVVQAGLVEQNAVFVVVEPERLGVAADDADLAAVRGAAGVPKNLEDQDAILAARESRYSLVGDRRNFGLAFVMCDGKARVGLDARQSLLRGVENIPRG